MIKRIAGVVLATLAAAHPSAQAGDTVTLYGRVNGGIDYVNKVATPEGSTTTLKRFNSNEWGISWWGLKGREDLGDGLSAVFNLESMFNTGDGTVPIGFFNRYAVVGLSDTKWGTVLFGRAMALTDGELWAVDPLGMQNVGVANLVFGRNWGPRTNAVTYNSPDYGPVSYRLQFGFGEQPDFKALRQVSASGSYTSGGLNVKLVYEELRDAKGTFGNLYSASREYAVGASYKIGAAKFFGGYSQLRSDSASEVDVNNPSGANRNNMSWVGINYEVTPLFSLMSGLYHADVNRDGGGATMLGLTGTYFLSKRTMLYATVAGVKNRGVATFSVDQTGDTRPLPGSSQQGTYAGVMHTF